MNLSNKTSVGSTIAGQLINAIDASETIEDLDKIAEKAKKLSEYWQSDEAKKKPWLDVVPAYTSYTDGDNYKNFIENRIHELLTEINYKVWLQKDYSYWYKWKFQEFYVYTKNQQFSKNELSLNVFKETDGEIKSLLVECMSLYKQLWNTNDNQNPISIWADLNTVDNKKITTLCKIAVIGNSKVALDQLDENEKIALKGAAQYLIDHLHNTIKRNK